MPDLLTSLSQALDELTGFVFCRLVETRGSTPQKAGAMMLVYPGGHCAGSVGGGCLEGDIQRAAWRTLSDAGPKIIAFHLDHDDGWDDGLICGGWVKVLIDPYRATDAMQHYYRSLWEIQQQAAGTEAVVCDPQAAALPEGSRYLFGPQQELLASLHGPVAAGPKVGALLKPLDERPRAYVVQGIAFLPALPRCRLMIFGGGHVGQAVADLAVQLDFDVWVVDDRAEYVSRERFPAAQQRLSGPLDQLLPELEFTPHTYCLIVTRGHRHDQQALYHLAPCGAGYVGMIGSRRKIKMIFDDLISQGVPVEALRRVYAPLGIHIGSQTLPEIAVSICAELVAHRNLGGHVPGRPPSIFE